MDTTLVFSDLHGNLAALQKLLERPGRFVFLGDAVGGAHDQACLELLRSAGVACLKGNHEVASSELPDWARRWPSSFVSGDVLFCHTWLGPGPKLDFFRLRSPSDALEMFTLADFRLAFVGHMHRPGWWELTSDLPRWVSAPSLACQPQHRYIVDVGSLDQGSYAVWTGDQVRFERL